MSQTDQPTPESLQSPVERQLRILLESRCADLFRRLWSAEWEPPGQLGGMDEWGGVAFTLLGGTAPLYASSVQRATSFEILRKEVLPRWREEEERGRPWGSHS